MQSTFFSLFHNRHMHASWKVAGFKDCCSLSLRAIPFIFIRKCTLIHLSPAAAAAAAAVTTFGKIKVALPALQYLVRWKGKGRPSVRVKEGENYVFLPSSSFPADGQL
jgi:fructose-specific phosphotransferase system IIC component